MILKWQFKRNVPITPVGHIHQLLATNTIFSNTPLHQNSFLAWLVTESMRHEKLLDKTPH